MWMRGKSTLELSAQTREASLAVERLTAETPTWLLSTKLEIGHPYQDPSLQGPSINSEEVVERLQEPEFGS